MKFKKIFTFLAGIVLVLLSIPVTSVAAEEAAVQLVLGGNGSTSWGIGPIAPGQSGTKTITVQNVGKQSGNLSIWISNIRNIEGTSDEFEIHTPGDLGELGSFLTLSLSGSQVISNVGFPATLDDLPHNALDSQFIRVWPLNPQEMVALNWEWNLPPEAGDIIQGDAISFDINYMLEELPPVPSSVAGGGGGGGSGGGGTSNPVPKSGPARFVEIDLLGDITRKEISDSSTLLESYSGKTADGSLTVSFSKGTSIISDSKQIPTRIAINIYAQTLPAGQNEYMIGNIYSIEVFNNNGLSMPTTFSPPFLITHAYDKKDLPPETKSIYLNRYDKISQKWSLLELPPAYTDKAGQLSAMVDQDLLYAAIANVYQSVIPVQAPARIVVKNLTISPSTIQLGKNVVIRGEAVNIGKLPGEQLIEFSVPGLALDRLVVKLAAGQRQEIKYSLTPSNAGDYEVILGDARGKFTAATVAPQGIYKAINMLSGADRGLLDWWIILLVIVIFILVFVFVLEKRRRRRNLLNPALEFIAGLNRRLSQRKSLTPIVESITGPTRYLKGPGPYKYTVEITGGRPPYTVEWKGNSVICSGPNCAEVELFPNQTWDSGKGNWVFFTVKDSVGEYAQWVNGDGIAKRLFTYGITYRNSVVTEPAIFPYKTPILPQNNDGDTISGTLEKSVKLIQKNQYKRVSAERIRHSSGKVSTRKLAKKDS